MTTIPRAYPGSRQLANPTAAADLGNRTSIDGLSSRLLAEQPLQIAGAPEVIGFARTERNDANRPSRSVPAVRLMEDLPSR
jgi:hypothetical protein